MADSIALLGKRIRTLRKTQNLTQEDLAMSADIGVKYLSRIERGDTNVTVKLLAQIAYALHVDMAELLEVKQEKNRAKIEEELISIIHTADNEKLRLLYRIASLQ